MTLNVQQAGYTRDALAKALYARLFDYLVDVSISQGIIDLILTLVLHKESGICGKLLAKHEQLIAGVKRTADIIEFG